MKVLAHLQAAPRPIGEIREGLPAALAGIVHRLLAKKTEDRFRTPAEVMAALEPFVEGSDIAGLYREIVRIPRDKHDLTLAQNAEPGPSSSHQGPMTWCSLPLRLPIQLWKASF